MSDKLLIADTVDIWELASGIQTGMIAEVNKTFNSNCQKVLLTLSCTLLKNSRQNFQPSYIYYTFSWWYVNQIVNYLGQVRSEVKWDK